MQRTGRGRRRQGGCACQASQCPRDPASLEPPSLAGHTAPPPRAPPLAQPLALPAGGAARPSSGPPGSGTAGPGSVGSLESLLLGKNRHLEHELTMARLRVVDTRQEADAAMALVAELEAKVGGWVVRRTGQGVCWVRGSGTCGSGARACA